jgi:hypothetical protein
MTQQYDIIIPVGPNDVHFVHRVVDYVWRCLVEARRIYVLTGKANFKAIARKLPAGVPMTLVDENELLEGLTFGRVKTLLAKYVPEGKDVRPGWYLQQFLKFAFARSRYAGQYYVTWDADTLPLAPIRYFDGEKLLYNPKHEYNYNYFRTMERLLGYGRQVDFSFIAENMIFSVEIVRELLADLERRAPEGMDWMEFILSACDFQDPLPAFSEFETYGNYCAVRHPGVYAPRHLNTFREAGLIAGRNITESQLRMLSFDLDTASFERFHIPSLSLCAAQRRGRWAQRWHNMKRMSLQQFVRKLRSKLLNEKTSEMIAVEDVLYRLPEKDSRLCSVNNNLQIGGVN